MRRFLLAGLLAGLGGMISGCGPLAFVIELALWPDPLQLTDVVWAKRPNFCASVIHRGARDAFPMQGRLDAPGYQPESIPLLWGGGPKIDDNRHAGADSLDLETVPRLEIASASYLYVTRQIRFEETRGLPPLPPEDAAALADAVKLAWRSVLYRRDDDGTLSRECVFVIRSLARVIAL